MSERVNKLYKPAELREVMETLQRVLPDQCDIAAIVKELHVLGFRIVKVSEP